MDGFFLPLSEKSGLGMLKTYEEKAGAKDENGPERKCFRYMENRPGQFRYKEALAAELPIGSGEIERVENLLNTRPREELGFETPLEAWERLTSA